MSATDDIAVPRDVSARVLRALRRRKDLWRFLAAVCRAVGARGGSVHLVGGFVRDLVEGRPGKDVDLMVTGIGFDVLGKILGSLPAKTLGIRRIAAVGRHFPVFKVAARWSAEDIDVALARRERSTGPGPREFDVGTDGVGARADAARRDFTINSLLFAFRPCGTRIGGEVRDYFGGLPDLRRRRIRGVGDPGERLREDPLRILRAIRLKSERPGYTIERGTWRALRSAAPSLVGTVPGERAISEILRSLAANPAGAIDDLRRAGILRIILPEARGRAVARTMRRYALLAESLGRPIPETVLLANLLVDIAEAESRASRAARGAPKVLRLPKTEAVARRLHVPGVRRVVRLVEDLVRLDRIAGAPNRNARIEAVFGRWTDPRWLLALYEAARKAASREPQDFRPVLRKAARKPALLSGEDLLEMGIPAGPGVESLLERVREATLSGEVATRDGAAALVASLSGAGPEPGQRHRRMRERTRARKTPAKRMASTAPSGPAAGV